ncbi:MAG TPA: MerR family transcriptional regulator [Candidatus Binataceae bacterium]|jgi:DNA-binding transcriptional MerR regulator
MTPVTRRPDSRQRPTLSQKQTAAAAAAPVPERGLKIGEAASALGVETYVLRFWETQFPFLKPKHSRTKHRFYQERDLEVLRLIKRLLHEEGFTIAGANKHIRERGLEALLSGKADRPTRAAAPIAAAPAAPAETAGAHPGGIDVPTRRVLEDVRRDLQVLHRMLQD